MSKSEKKIWFISFPTHQYVEDVRELAREHNLKIIDARFDDGTGAEDTPELTLKSAESNSGAKEETGKDSESEGEEEAENGTGSDDGANDNHAKLIEWFSTATLNKVPLVREAEAELGIDTNGAEIDAAWTAYKAESSE